MCGIAGYYNLTQKQFAINDTWLEAMQQSLEHRGPDGYRIWSSPEHEAAFVHRRLSIVDLSPAGFQPFFDDEKSVAIMCNGEIYNHRALRAELEALGHRYHSQSDSETILYAYKQWGIDCLKRFEGMFAIAILDMRKRELYLVRDRIGIKPLYFSLQHDILSFASEIKALWCLPWMQKTIKRDALYHYLTYLVTPAPMTLYEGIYKLPAGHYLKVDAQKEVTFHEWYTPLVNTVDKAVRNDEQYWIDTIRSSLRSSIEKRMMADVPFGVFLSGGIDSSLNVALMSEFTDRVKTFTVSFSDGPEYNEVLWARKVAKEFNTEHHEIEISEKDAFDFFERMVYHQDEPIGDSVCIPLYYVSQLLKNRGVTVVQVGEGSDELFCGYSSYAQYVDVYNRYWNPSQKMMPSIARKGAYYMAARMLPSKTNRLSMLKDWADGRNLFWSGATAFTEDAKHDLFSSCSVSEPDPIIEKIYPGFEQLCESYSVVDYHLKKLKSREPDADFLKSMIYLELKHRLPELLLMRVDKMTMATSVEARVPFLDHQLVEKALQIPSHLKYKNGVTKYILKKACEGILPHDVIYRKKMGFAAPTHRWFKTGKYFKSYFNDMLETKRSTWGAYLDVDAIHKMHTDHESGVRDYSVQLWVLQNVLACEGP